jgi:hypothetical protein
MSRGSYGCGWSALHCDSGRPMRGAVLQPDKSFLGLYWDNADDFVN